MPTILIFLYIVLVVVVIKKFSKEFILDFDDKFENEMRELNELREKKDLLFKEKMELEEEAIKIFTLYEITKEITQSLSEEEAFKTFKRKLSEHVSFTACNFYKADSEEVKDLERAEDNFLFTLQGKRRIIGYLFVDGVSEKDKEKVAILGHQFALALRRVDLYQEIERVAITDSLTGVHTRRYLLERFAEEIKRSRSIEINLATLMIDVDLFKNLNDKYGHLTGDQVLREVGSMIKENIREIDIAGRYGGEEFCIVLPDTGYKGAKYVAERIRSAIEQDSIRAYDTSIKVTVSIGISSLPKDGYYVNDLIDKADLALYQSKKEGRNRVSCFTKEETS
ncbi:MAG: GGDEF domain-containing protein [Candidatus Zapsychrus exili]|nr:GGDEF domain-containing protein [Candidatus Zapsychrus exili]